MKISSLLSSATPEIIKRPIRRFLAPIRLRNSWLNRSSTNDDNHLVTYWNAGEQPNRLLLIDILYHEANVLLNECDSISLLEYGSHVGLNMKLLNDRYAGSKKIRYFAVEPNSEAVKFLRDQLDYVDVLEAEDEIFCRNISFPPQSSNYLSFVNSVFYSMDPRRVQRVLEKITKISNVIVIGESLQNIDGKRSILRDNPECFEHPYRLWLDELGYKIEKTYVAPEPKPQLDGYLIARPK